MLSVILSPVMNVKENHSLKNQNTFGLDISARWYTEISDIEQLQEIISDRRFSNIRMLILGGGSNILFTKDFDGLFIKNKIEEINIKNENENEALVSAGAGVNWHSFVLYTIDKNFPGIENLSLIPGCVGAAPIQNIGAYGVEMKNTFRELTAVDLRDGTLKKFISTECRFGYRDSIFKQEAKNIYAIVNVTFAFDKKAKLNTTYGAIEEELNKMGIKNPTIRDVSNAVVAIRQSKLPDPKDIGNAGSFFKNPEIPVGKFNELKEKFPDIVGYPSYNNVKLAAGWLIEQCGWKGKRVGETGMHARQALVLVNYGNAKGNEIYEHAVRVHDSVMNKFNVDLEMEVNIL